MDLLFNIWFIAVGLFALGFSIFIHELGHFIAAKKRGLVADRFSIGFGPRLFGWHKNGTDFRISLLPFGGYVSLPQLADMGRLEGGEDDDEAERLPPISYADKMIVAVMGAVFNIIFAFLISLVLWGVGRDIVKSTEIDAVFRQMENSEGEFVQGPAYEAGLQPGDTIIRIDDQKIINWMGLTNTIMTGTGRTDDGRPMATVEVLRDEKVKAFTVYPILVKLGIDETRTIGVAPSGDLFITEVMKDMPAAEAGLEPDDQLIALDDRQIESSAFLQVYLSKHDGGPIDLTVLRKGEELVFPIEPKAVLIDGRKINRFGFTYERRGVATERVHYNPLEQLGIMANTMRQTLVALVHPESDVRPKNMSGPVGIVHGLTNMARLGWIDLIWFLALINVNLAIFNLLPIPVLDGGHMMFATISKVIGRPLPRKLMENVQMAFVVVLLTFVVYVSFFDVQRVGWDAGLLDGGETGATENESTEEAGNKTPDGNSPSDSDVD